MILGSKAEYRNSSRFYKKNLKETIKMTKSESKQFKLFFLNQGHLYQRSFSLDIFVDERNIFSSFTPLPSNLAFLFS